MMAWFNISVSIVRLLGFGVMIIGGVLRWSSVVGTGLIG